jgi:hypothetical protein
MKCVWKRTFIHRKIEKSHWNSSKEGYCQAAVQVSHAKGTEIASAEYVSAFHCEQCVLRVGYFLPFIQFCDFEPMYLHKQVVSTPITSAA